MQSLSRKMALRATTGVAARALSAARAVSRTGQVSRSTVTLGDDEAFVDEVLSSAQGTNETVDSHEVELSDSRDVSDDVVDALPEMTEDSWEAEDVGQLAADGADWVADQVGDAVARVDAATEVANAAAEVAASAQETADGKNARRSGETEPDPPPGGWVHGDQWVVRDAEGVATKVMVWNGSEFVLDELLAGSVLVLGEDGVIRLADGVVTAPAVATDALDAKVIRAPRVYGGYIEAPTIASSDALGNGANVLNDPEFSGAVNGDWVLSGHAGDAAATQRDTITWDQTWNERVPSNGRTLRSVGSVVAEMRLTPIERLTGSMLLANFAWFNAAPRTVNNPHTYAHGDSLPLPREDRSFRAAPAAPALKPYVPRTTYLTNTAVVAVVAGEQWAVVLETTKSGYVPAGGMQSASVQIVNSSTGAVIYEYPIPDEQLRAGHVEMTWTPTSNALVKLRIKAVYTSGGAVASSTRATTVSSSVKHFAAGAERGKWDGGGWDKYLRYGSVPDSTAPSPGAATGAVNPHVTWTILSAMFGTRAPAAGWRLSTEGGLELFNEIGARTGKVDGVENFLAGRFATSDTGNRIELKGRELAWLEGADAKWAYINYASDRRMTVRSGYIFLDGIVEFRGDRPWTPVTDVPSGYTASADAAVCVKNGVLYGRGSIQRNFGTFQTTTFTLCKLPAAFPKFGDAQNFVPAWTNQVSSLGVTWVRANGEVAVSAGNNGGTGIALTSLNGLSFD